MVQAENPTAMQVDTKYPRCPNCHADLVNFNEATLTFQTGIVAHMFICSNDECRTLLSMQIVGQAKPQRPTLVGPGAASALASQLNDLRRKQP